MHQQWRIQGDFFPLYLGHRKFYFVYDPEIVGHMLCHHPEYYRKSRLVFNKIQPITGKQGLVQLENEPWHQIRKLTNPLFYKKSLASFLPVIDTYLNGIIDKFDENKGSAIDISSLFVNYTLKTIIKIVTGMEGDKNVEEIAETFYPVECYLWKKLTLDITCVVT